MNNIELCLECGNFPCTCGEQYKQLPVDQLLGLTVSLLEVAKSKVPLANYTELGQLQHRITQSTTYKKHFEALAIDHATLAELPRLWKQWFDTINAVHQDNAIVSQALQYLHIHYDVAEDNNIDRILMYYYILCKLNLSKEEYVQIIINYISTTFNATSESPLYALFIESISYKNTLVDKVVHMFNIDQCIKVKKDTMDPYILNVFNCVKEYITNEYDNDLLPEDRFWRLVQLMCVINDVYLPIPLTIHNINKVGQVTDELCYAGDNLWKAMIKIKLPIKQRNKRLLS